MEGGDMVDMIVMKNIHIHLCRESFLNHFQINF